MKVIIITIGDELLIGQVIDSNAAWIGQQLNEIGVAVKERLTVGDTLDGIIGALNYAHSRADLVIMTGGLGPTRDDITKKAIAQFLNVELEFHEETWERIQRLFKKFEKEPTEAHKEQCLMPQGTHFLKNKMGTAPGMLFKKDSFSIISMPGVPYEMMSIMQDEVLPMLDKETPDLAIYHKTIQTAGEGESRLADKIQDIIDQFPEHISIAYLPNLGKVRLRLTAHGKDKSELQREVDTIANKITDRLSVFVFGSGKDTLHSVLGKELRRFSLKIGTAESCTGGHLAHMITSVPNSSDYYQGSIIAYSNAVKISQLNVSEETLNKYGAVSEQTVREMLQGLIQNLKVDVGISVSGIAGPGGGSAEKPVGTIWVACGNAQKVVTKKLNLGKNRIKNIEYTSTYALNMMRLFLKKHYDFENRET